MNLHHLHSFMTDLNLIEADLLLVLQYIKPARGTIVVYILGLTSFCVTHIYVHISHNLDCDSNLPDHLPLSCTLSIQVFLLLALLHSMSKIMFLGKLQQLIRLSDTVSWFSLAYLIPCGTVVILHAHSTFRS